jgi:hypothetical protein
MEAVAREGTTSAAGGRAPMKMQKPVQVIRTTVSMKPTPTKKK